MPLLEYTNREHLNRNVVEPDCLDHTSKTNPKEKFIERREKPQANSKQMFNRK